MKALVTGGAGFIGSHLVDALCKRGDEVLVVDDLSNGRAENVNPNAKLLTEDIGEGVVSKLIDEEKPEVIFHLAAHIDVRRSVEEPSLDAKANILGSLNLIKAAAEAGIKKFVFSSTGGAIYGNATEIPTPETYPPKPLSPYGIAKLAVEGYIKLWEGLFGIKYTALRYSNVFGPRQGEVGEAGVTAIFARKLLSGGNVTIFGDGEQTRDYVYVSDVVEANLLAAGSADSGIFNISTGIETSVNTVFDKLLKLSGKKVKHSYLPLNRGEVLRSALDYSLAREKLGWEPKVPFEEGIERTFDYFLAQQRQ
ncbi:NAD-dependent epimerase/dehydratase family protein [Candidatus Saccharibacteria bacterium]|nr:NAD-dependent epimerase/dehydratase family protein [Candidatus Saccharibacteria bacterium]